jgi:hypothetical protein
MTQPIKLVIKRRKTSLGVVDPIDRALLLLDSLWAGNWGISDVERLRARGVIEEQVADKIIESLLDAYDEG